MANSNINTLQRLRGVNLGGWFSQVDCIEEKDPKTFPGLISHIDSFIGDEDFQRIKDWGFNHVRIPFDYFNAFDDNGEITNLDVLDRYEKALDKANAFGLLAILDLHKCPGHDFYTGINEEQKFFTEPKFREAAKNVWAVFAERFADKEHVIFEILNEPVASTDAIWDEVKNEMFTFIRSKAPKSTVLIGSNRWNAVDAFPNLTPVDDDNVVYSFHFYNPVIFTHQLVPWHLEDEVLQTKRSYPGIYIKPEGVKAHSRLENELGKWDIDRMKDYLSPVIEFRKKYNVPVSCNEFGVFVQVERSQQMNWMIDFSNILKEADIGFSYWNYKNLDFGLNSIGEQLHQDLIQYQNPERCDHELAKLLSGV